MKVLFSTGCLFYLPMRDIFLLAKEAGFDGCELVIDGRFNDSRHIDVMLECLDILPVYSIHAPFMKMHAWGNEAYSLMRSVEIAKLVGTKLVGFHPPNWFSMEIAFFQWFRKVQDFQKKLGGEGVVVAIENMPRIGKRLMLAPYVLNDFEDLIEFGVKRNLFFTFDTTHLATFGGDIIVAFLSFLKTSRLKNIHLSDYSDYRSHLFPGNGELPVVKLLNTAARLGYDGMVTLEVSPYELPRTRECLKRMLRYQVAFLNIHLQRVGNG
ncbi:sugar phosphate isomerase/epimerase family protein [Syntrophorhabdus aromaticivorans]|jgi:sugar phosphate isomerase/epimerase|uniref:Sugar phosphate isomerase/epimerase n=1 Tax=Syntrophorhabdus aromaticivorans TaxID=328301 RepID=A0A351U757_9BACT|nr:sugar phosphate isomerase/epimerase [Syntrophorhabdus aromaticivorans]NLW35570.1 sugar phosphate isomerase/epimerase [Syntrophorhabdus aromaticivorans]HBA55788.1 sugar phosphate isomerase/epimerase [Syntrophorhabdus aromaticivorans]